MDKNMDNFLIEQGVMVLNRKSVDLDWRKKDIIYDEADEIF